MKLQNCLMKYSQGHFKSVSDKDGITILSVRRKSDQAIFDVGQPVDVHFNGEYIKTGRITAFYVAGDFRSGMCVEIAKEHETKSRGSDLSIISHHLKWEGQ